MREILFRGKRKDNDKWVEGDSLVHSMYKKGDVCIGVVEGMEIHTVDLDTIGQYTGLTDKNGTKIFEGDILKFSYNGKDENPVFYSIGWKSDRACFGYAETADKMIEVDCLHCEVVGNIHDNPELLKEREG